MWALYSGWRSDIIIFFQLHDLSVEKATKIYEYFETSLTWSPVFTAGYFYLLHQKLRDEGKSLKDLAGSQIVSSEKIEGFRNGSGSQVFLGIDKDAGKPLFLTSKELNLHSQVMGATGFGKTASVLMSELNNHIREGRGLVLIDGKASKDLLLNLKLLAKKYGREDDLLFFSLAYPELSNHYNPLIHGSPTELKDKLIGSQIWSEEFYKKEAERILTTIFNACQDQGVEPSFELVEQAIKHPQGLGFSDFKSDYVRRRFQDYCESHKKNLKNYSGIAADLMNITDSVFGSLFVPAKGGNIDILDAYLKNKIVFFQIPTSRFEDTAKRVGRTILYDLKAIASYIESEIMPEDRHFFPVIIDEFASFAFPSFIDFINKARSSGMAICVLHQSMGDLKAATVGDHFSQQISENTNVKIFMRTDDPDTIQYCVDMIGTKQVKIFTYETETKFLFRQKTGGASERQGDEYIIDPNEFRNLKIGEAIVYIKSRSKAYRISLDYIEQDLREISFAFEKDRAKALQKFKALDSSPSKCTKDQSSGLNTNDWEAELVSTLARPLDE